MGAKNGKDLLLKVDMTSDGLFETIAGLKTTNVTFNAATIDVTSLESEGGWRELLGGAGIRSASLTGTGVFKDAHTDERMRQIFFGGDTPQFQAIIPSFGILTGPFQVTNLSYAGSHDGEATYSVTLASAGALNFAPLSE